MSCHNITTTVLPNVSAVSSKHVLLFKDMFCGVCIIGLSSTDMIGHNFLCLDNNNISIDLANY